MVTKKIKIKDKDGIVTEVDIGAEAKNISEDAAHRFTSDTEKEKLNGIDEGANKYTHPTTSGNKHIPSGGSTGKILGWKADGEAQWVDDKNTTYSAFKGATSAAAGGTGLVPAPAAGDQAKFLSGDGTWDSVNDMAPTFTQAETRANIASGEKVPTLFGKIAKWFTDLKTGAFATVVNNLTTTAASTVLDGRQGKALNDKITAINSALKENLNSNGKSLTNSSYYPSSTIYRSGQVVYLRCSGVTTKEIPANTELTIATEGTVPEEYRGNNDMIFYPIISLGGKTIRVFIGANGKVTFTSPGKLEVGFGVNMHVAYMTGKSNFS